MNHGDGTDAVEGKYRTYDKYIFQNKPIKFAYRTRKGTGMNIKLIRVAAGQIVQFTFRVSQSFDTAYL